MRVVLCFLVLLPALIWAETVAPENTENDVIPTEDAPPDYSEDIKLFPPGTMMTIDVTDSEAILAWLAEELAKAEKDLADYIVWWDNVVEKPAWKRAQYKRQKKKRENLILRIKERIIVVEACVALACVDPEVCKLVKVTVPPAELEAYQPEVYCEAPSLCDGHRCRAPDAVCEVVEEHPMCSPCGHNTECEEGLVCVDGECETPCDPPCAPGEICNDGDCGADLCAGVTCEVPLVCDDHDGVCKDPCDNFPCEEPEMCMVDDSGPYCDCNGVRCEDNQRCATNAEGVVGCETDPCADIVCPPGEMCVEGSCDADPCAECPEGQMCGENDQGERACVDDPCALCLPEEMCEDGICVPIPPLTLEELATQVAALEAAIKELENNLGAKLDEILALLNAG